MSLIREYLAMEHHSEATTPDVEVNVEVEVEVPEVQDVLEEEVYEAEEVLAEVGDEREDLQAIRNEAVSVEQEMTEHIASVEHYADILSHGIESGQFSPQFAASVDFALERYNNLLGGSLSAKPALEDYGHEDLQTYYETSMEAFGDISKALKGAVSGIKAKVERRIHAVGGAKKAGEAITKKADANLNALSDITTGEKASVLLSGIVDRFNHDGKFPDSLVAAVGKDINETLAVGKAYRKDVDTFVGDLSDVLKKAAGTKAEDDVAKIVGELGGKKLPVDSITDKPLLGSKIVFDGPSVIDGNTTAESIKTVVKKGAFPELETTKTQGGPKEIELTKADVTTLFTRAKQYAEASSQLSTLEENAGQTTAKFEQTVSGLGVGMIHDDLQPLTGLVGNTIVGSTFFMADLAIGCRTKAIALNQLGERAIAALNKAEKAAKKDAE